MKIIFVGTAEFAAPILESVAQKTDWKIVFVISEPAKPHGRNQVVVDSPVATAAQKIGLDVFTPQSIAEPSMAEKIKEAQPDVIILADYGQIVPREIFNLARFKTINIHPSLLPKLRGASPIQAALLAGLKETGVSLMVMDEKLDSGPILSQEKLSISETDNYFSLEAKAAQLASAMTIRDIPRYISGELKPENQNESETTYAPKIKKEDGRINWQKSADEIYNQYRAFVKWPGIFTFFKNKNGDKLRLKLIEIEKAESAKNNSAGEVFTDNSKNIFISCAAGAVKFVKVQPENSKILSPAEFLNGYGYIVGQILG